MIKLLFVEDDEDCAYAIQGGLEMLDLYEVRCAVNGREALKIYDNFRPDVVVSDVQMPEMNGFELAHKIRDINPQVIIVLATGLTSPKDLRDGYGAGIDEYIKKPFIAEELHYHIQAILKRIRNNSDVESIPDNNTQLINIGRYVLNPENETLSLNNRITQKLTSREAQLLFLLYNKQNRLIPRSEILQLFWPKDDPVFSSRSLDVFISKLRKYLAEDKFIQIVNERGKGLKLLTKQINPI